MISFHVAGRPIPQGSMRPMVSASTGRPFVKQAPALAVWRADVAEAARRAGCLPRQGPVKVNLVFSFARPKAHYGTGRNAGRLKDSAPESPINRATGDLDKLARAVLDALSQVAYEDDSQVVLLAAMKRFSEDAHVGATITVSYL